jgi:hypothetical protein
MYRIAKMANMCDVQWLTSAARPTKWRDPLEKLRPIVGLGV